MAQPLLFSDPYRTDLSTPGAIFGTGGGLTPGDYASTQAAQPFVWGQGGARLTADQLAQRQKQATSLQQADYSPIASPWQGLARVANNALGAFEQKGLDKEAQAQQADSQAIIQALAGSDPTAQSSAVAAALSGSDPTAQKYALQVDARLHPKAPAPNDFERALTNGGVAPGTDQWKTLNFQRAQSQADPLTNFVVGGNSVVGPRSLVQQQFSAPAATAPPAEAISYLRSNPSTSAQFDETFGQGSAQRILGSQ